MPFMQRWHTVSTPEYPLVDALAAANGTDANSLAATLGQPLDVMEDALSRLMTAFACRECGGSGEVEQYNELVLHFYVPCPSCSPDDDSDECPDCGFALAEDMSGGLVRTERSREAPCASCLWAHGDDGS